MHCVTDRRHGEIPSFTKLVLTTYTSLQQLKKHSVNIMMLIYYFRKVPIMKNHIVQTRWNLQH